MPIIIKNESCDVNDDDENDNDDDDDDGVVYLNGAVGRASLIKPCWGFSPNME